MAPILGIWASGTTPSKQNSYESIATTTVGAGGVSSITFSSIPSTYTHLQVRCFTQTNRGTYNIDSFGMALNGVGGTSYTTHYMQSQNQGNGTVVAGSNVGTGSFNPICDTTTSTGAGGFGAAIIDILDYTNTNKNRTIRALSGADANGLLASYTTTVQLSSGLFSNTSAISQIVLFPTYSSLFNQYSSFALYGIKG